MNNISNLIDSITAILVNNNLDELSLGEPDQLDDPTFVIWYDNHGIPYDDPIIKVIRDNSGLSFVVNARDFDNTVTIQDHDIDRLEWWCGIHANVLEILERDGKLRCPSCGKPLKGRQKFCSGICQNLAMPQLTTLEIVELANKRIQKLITRIARGDRKLKQLLTEEFIFQL